MTKICSKCKKPAVTFIRYNGTHLCEDHFIRYFEKRVKKNIRKQGKTKSGSVIAVALSGGKDSSVALQIIHDIFSVRPDVKVLAITVDEGIKNYRDKSIRKAKKNCERLDVKHHIVSFEEMIGLTMDEITDEIDELGECSYCGVFRRSCINRKAKELDADKLVTGHNLDDMAQSILMNFVNSDMKKLARLPPHKKVQPGLVPRMIPLSVIPEKETALYAILKNIEFYNAKCPYSTDAFRGVFQEIINDLEYKNPGTRHSILRSYEDIRDLLFKKYPPADLNKCKKCNEPTSKEICKTCMLKDKIMKKI